jgi:integrase
MINNDNNTQRTMRFLLAKEAEGLSPLTLKYYQSKLQNIPDLTEDAIRAWLIDLRKTHTPGGVHAFYRALHAYCTWLATEYDMPNPIRRVKAPKVPEEILDPLPQFVLDAMLSKCDTTWHGVRDRAILLLLDATGMRAGELCALDTEDLDIPLMVVYIRHGKGGHPRAVDYDKKTKHALKAWYQVRGENPAFFMSSYGNRLDLDTLRGILIRRAQDAGVQYFSAHAYRRKHALDLHRAGESLLTIQRRLGHHSDLVLKRYIKLSREDMIAAAARFHKR